MKYTVLVSLLLLGVCSARTLDTSRPREMEESMKMREDDSKTSQEDRREEDKTEEKATQQWTQFKETIYQKLRGMYQQMSFGNSRQIDNMPQFADPIYIGSISDQWARHSVNYENVQFQGLGSADRAIVSVDTDSQEATLTLSLNSAEISGNYKASDSTTSGEGKFNIQMTGDLSYVCTYHYQQDGDNVQLQQSNGKMHYSRPINNYENSEFPESIWQSLQTKLWRAVNERLHSELHSKLSGNVLQYVKQVVSGQQEQEPVEKMLRDNIKSAVNGIQQALSKRGVSSMELISNDREMMHNKLRAKISSVKLSGFDKLYLANSRVSCESSDKVRATLEFAIDRPTATAVVNIHEAHDENTPFQKITVDFDMEKLMAELMLEKPNRQSGLNLRSYKAKVNRVRPVGIEKFDSEVRDLIKEKMADHMKRYVEDSLNKFIVNEYVAIKNKAISSQEKRSEERKSAPGQM